MRRLERAVAAAALAAAALASAQGAPVGDRSVADLGAAPWLADAETRIEQDLAAYRVPGLAIAVVQGDAVVYARGFGVRDLASNAPVDTATLFRIGSTTKSMTSLLQATFVDDGLLAWDAPVASYGVGFALPTPALTAEVTVAQMLGMGTGLTDGVNPLYWAGTSAEEVWDELPASATLPGRAPGETFYYNNHLYAAGGYLAPKVEGVAPGALFDAYREAMQERVFDPIGMASATITDDPSALSDNVALPYEVDLLGELRPIANQETGGVAPAGGAVVNVVDMARYVATQLHGGVAPDGVRVASEINVARTHDPRTPMSANPAFPGDNLGYAMGWAVTDYHGHTLVHHAGGVSGYRSEMLFVPDLDLGVVVFTNAYFGGYLATSALFAVLDSRLGLGTESRDRIRSAYEGVRAARAELAARVVPLDPASAEPWLGRYERGWEVVLDGDELRARNRGWDFGLLPTADGTFLTGSGGDLTGLTVRFDTADDGTVSLVLDELDTVAKLP